jgi:hypothetical protein
VANHTPAVNALNNNIKNNVPRVALLLLRVDIGIAYRNIALTMPKKSNPPKNQRNAATSELM